LGWPALFGFPCFVSPLGQQAFGSWFFLNPAVLLGLNGEARHITWVWRYGGGLKYSQLYSFYQLHPQPDHLITRLQLLATLPVLQAALAIIE
jgi:hypothetical protein